jgi:hypothetical protein
MFWGCRLRIVEAVLYRLVIAGRGQKRLCGHVPIECAGKVKRGHDALYQSVVVEYFFLDVALFVYRIPPDEALLYRQVGIDFKVHGDGFILRIHDSDLVGFLLRGHRLPFIEQCDARLVQPLT